MSRIAIIACDHGLGHIRRCLLVAAELQRRGTRPTLLAPAGAVTRALRTLGDPARYRSIDVVDFATMTTPEALRSGDAATTSWHTRLPNIDRYDRVITDTMPEVLEVRPDAMVLAQFLWHDVLEGIDAHYKERASGLVQGASLIIGSALFAMPAVTSLPAYRPVGLYMHTLHPSSTAPRPERPEVLLIAGGSTEALRTPLRNLTKRIANRDLGTWERILVDRDLMPPNPPPGIQIADHTPSMYDDVTTALIRPGLGTLTELLARETQILCIREDGNAELRHNAEVVVELHRGLDLGAGAYWSPDAVHAALDGQPSLHGAQQRMSPERLNFRGAAEAAELIVTHRVDR